MTLKFNRTLEVVKVHLCAKFHRAKCSGSGVINSALDFGQLLDFNHSPGKHYTELVVLPQWWP